MKIPEGYRRGKDLTINDVKVGDSVFDDKGRDLGSVTKIARTNFMVDVVAPKMYGGGTTHTKASKGDVAFVIRNMVTPGDWVSGTLHVISSTKTITAKDVIKGKF